MPLPLNCSVPSAHLGFTWDPSGRCVQHRPPRHPGAVPRASFPLDQLRRDWDTFLGAHARWFGGQPPEPAELDDFIAALYRRSTAVEVNRAVPVLDIADWTERNRRAWDVRHQISAALFPYWLDDVEVVDRVALHQVDAHGPSLESMQTVLSFVVTLSWKIRAATEPQTPPVPEYIETTGATLLAEEAHPVYGMALYLFPQLFLRVTGAPPRFAERFDDALLAVPPGYETAEQQFRAHRDAQIAHTTAQQAAAAAAVQQRRQSTRKAWALGLGIVGEIISAEAQHRDEKAHRQYVRDRNYNAAQQAERNRRASRWP